MYPIHAHLSVDCSILLTTAFAGIREAPGLGRALLVAAPPRAPHAGLLAVHPYVGYHTGTNTQVKL